ncbi:MAG: glycosyltransferase [Anaerolineae bacterium]|nr:glycosyltransferase [Anaerolineae bacterium]
MKVVEVSYTWPAETFIQRHVLALREAGADVMLVGRAGVDAGRAGASIGDADCRIPALVMPNFDHLDLTGKVWSLRHLLARPRWAMEARPLRDRVLLAFFERLKPDLIHFHTASLAAFMRWVPQALGIPYTVSLRGSDVQVMPLRSERAAQETGAALREAAGVHAISWHLVACARRWAGPQVRIQVIYNPIPLPPLLPPFRPGLGQSLHLITVGRLHWTKCYGDLLQASAELARQGIETRVTFVGSGPEESRLRYWVEKLELADRVTFLGKTTFQQVSSLLSDASAYVHPSMSEGFGNAIAEAMAWGCPVFITDACGAREVIEDGKSGFLLPALQPETWPERLLLARDRALMERVRQAAYETARRLFDRRRHAEDFLAFYERAVRRGPNLIARESKSPSHGEQPRGEGPLLLVRGAWRWENGADLVLRALAPLCREGQVQVVFMGQGPQEDELRYLADFLGLGGQVRFIVDGQADDLGGELSMVLDIADAQEQGWRLTWEGTLVANVPFAEVGHLSALVEDLPR